ncbi:MAG TPA: tRNA preQ1(34) S-adenosylmethionine ribosyltransferase-isomerase QueA [Candidatus Omnitrophica bacterium]|nr:MAG: tRNA preQ1(34) S-adenosylmethionine ribosyltransferase-isomerase QueA [Omnitrophica WOR_2 bacterium GWA2_53_43]HCI45397.1 tRNA preQ1(34) S-adenosylmethionine ribosyltransferase-isomerase QueA [Candidatus Omnitrophota bacterium]
MDPENTLRLCEFDFDLPQELIAQYPLRQRDQARLMVIDRQNQAISHDVFAKVEKYLPPGSCIVLNDSKVIPARLLGRREKTPGKVEVFLLKKLPEGDGCSYEALIRPLNRLELNEKIQFNGGSLTAEITDIGKRIVRFNRKNIPAQLQRHGHMPLPPYIKRADEPLDHKYYQTVYARKPGSVASPTAGLHFTPALLNALREKGHGIETVTLHVNLATFRMVEAQDITRHKMHTEEYSLTKKSFVSIQQAKTEGRKIVAVGTTSCRVLETSVEDPSRLAGETDIFIYPGYTFRSVDVMITNFHLPRSTLLMLVYAFGGTKLMKKAYARAIREKYRFYSYGDAMIIV